MLAQVRDWSGATAEASLAPFILSFPRKLLEIVGLRSKVCHLKADDITSLAVLLLFRRHRADRAGQRFVVCLQPVAALLLPVKILCQPIYWYYAFDSLSLLSQTPR